MFFISTVDITLVALMDIYIGSVIVRNRDFLIFRKTFAHRTCGTVIEASILFWKFFVNVFNKSRIYRVCKHEH